MVLKKEVVKIKGEEATELWNKRVKSVPIRKYSKEAGDSEKMILFSETGAGKTRFYLKILEYLKKKGVKKEDLKMFIIYPDRPQGLSSLIGFIPKEYEDNVEVFAVNNYEDTIIATASAIELLEQHHKETGVYGWLVFELMENYWTFSMDYYCRMAYGQTIGEYFTQMQSILNKDKAEKRTAFEAFAGPFGGPWPIIKFKHNFNWMDKLKRMPYNMIFTSELREEDNKDSVFSSLGFRPAGEKHTQHKVNVILYLSHKGNNFFMKPYKLTGYTKFYGELNITNKNGYEEHMKALSRLKELGHRVSKWDELEKEAGITPPKAKKEPEIKEVSKQEMTEEQKESVKQDEADIPEERKEKPPEKKKEESEEDWVV